MGTRHRGWGMEGSHAQIAAARMPQNAHGISPMSNTFLPFARPDYDDAELLEVADAVRRGWITTGTRTAQFEHDFRQYVQARHALAVNSCTAGLHLALAALGIGPGDEVITTPLTFCATVNVILEVGATPVLADIGPDLN